MLSVAQHEGNFDSFAEDSAIYLKKTPDSPEALTIVRAESMIGFNPQNPTFYEAVFETGHSALEERSQTLHGGVATSPGPCLCTWPYQ